MLATTTLQGLFVQTKGRPGGAFRFAVGNTLFANPLRFGYSRLNAGKSSDSQTGLGSILNGLLTGLVNYQRYQYAKC